MNKKNLISVLVLILVFCVGCAQQKGELSQNQIKALSTIAMIGDLVKQVGGEFVSSEVLIKGELDPHTYELVKGDAQKFQVADVIFANGLDLEHSMSLKQTLQNHPNVIKVCDQFKQQEGVLLYAEGQYDPHVWLDISLWAQTLEPICAALVKLDPPHQEYFESRKEVLKQKLLELDQVALERFSKLHDTRRYLVTSHDAFHYFVRRYLHFDWEKRCAAPEGLAPEAQVSATDIAQVAEFIHQHQVAVAFTESNVNQDALYKIAKITRQAGRKLVIAPQSLYSDAMGEAKGYYEMMQHNLNEIAQGLENETSR